MAYSAQILRRARQKLESQKADRQSQYRERLQAAYIQLPRLRQIDQQLRSSMALAAQAVFAKGGDAMAAMEQVREANLALQRERQALIAANFQPGYLDENPLCHRCGGAGYVGSTMCTCLQQLCLQEQKLAIAGLTTGAERFETFRLDYYPDRVDGKYGASPRAIMERNLQACRRYAQPFQPGNNLLFVGGTGLGKTFLSACIANAVTEQGYSVAYESAARLFSALEKNRFSPDEGSREAVASLESCDLLIIDDLGTELPGSFVTAALYSLVNDRLLSGKSMIVSTNLNIDEIARRYSPQIASRLQGSFRLLPFVGEDIRVLKNRGL
jgi:DNA replication protein DnaC